jgi:hypothetical protein
MTIPIGTIVMDSAIRTRDPLITNDCNYLEIYTIPPNPDQTDPGAAEIHSEVFLSHCG